ncbi:MAG: RidA family protein [Sporichthyaceae bacterium]|nr:RidA family protein [Sporichthyaceae bacterium]
MPVHDRITAVSGLAPPPGYSHAVTASGHLAFVSGQIALDTDGQVVGIGDLAVQTEQALTNLHRIIKSMGADWPDVLKLGWYLLDVKDVQIIREVRNRVIRPALGDLPNPASTLVQVAALVRPEFLVEVDAVVAVPD